MSSAFNYNSLSLPVKVLRETLVFLAPLAVQVSPALRERLASPVSLVLPVAPDPLDLQEWLCRAPKDFKDHQDLLEEEVMGLIIKVPSPCMLPEVAAWFLVF